ncbi:MAG TPA: cation:proton antiporter, partial [Candidatus Thermoplasmatota archaeon]|nr:cation:proton antiporter [Candidatus Thermoplasmatota archaeon]
MSVAVGPILLDLVVLLVAAKLAGELAERIGQPPVLGELLAGILLGPSLLAFIDLSGHGGSVPLVVFVAQVGAILLLFEVGLETRLKDMTSVGRSAALVALLGIVGSFAVGFGTSWALARAGLWSDRLLFHVFVGATLTATSVGITARVLSDMGRLATPEARTILGAAVLDDVGGLLILAVVSALAAGSVDPWVIARQAGLGLLFLAGSVMVGVRLAPRALDLAMRLRARGLLVVVGVAFAFLMAYLAEVVGLASIVGAFAAGLILAQTRQHAALHERTRTLADLFVPVFFVYVGLQMDLRVVAGSGATFALVAGALFVAAVAGKLLAGLGVLERGMSRLAVGVG